MDKNSAQYVYSIHCSYTEIFAVHSSQRWLPGLYIQHCTYCCILIDLWLLVRACEPWNPMTWLTQQCMYVVQSSIDRSLYDHSYKHTVNSGRTVLYNLFMADQSHRSFDLNFQCGCLLFNPTGGHLLTPVMPPKTFAYDGVALPTAQKETSDIISFLI